MMTTEPQNISTPLLSITERDRPHYGPVIYYSSDLKPKQATRHLADAERFLQSGERVLSIAMAMGMMSYQPLFVTNRRTFFTAGSSVGKQVRFSEGTLRPMKGEAHVPTTRLPLEVAVGDKVVKYGNVAKNDQDYIRFVIEREKVRGPLDPGAILAKLVNARDETFGTERHPVPAAEAAQALTPQPPAAGPAVAPSSAPESQPVAPPGDMSAAIAQLKQLAELHEAGVLSNGEFARAKACLGFGEDPEA